MDMDPMLNFSYLDMAKAIIDRFNDLLRLSERLFPFHDGDTPLLFAVRRNTGNLDVIKNLLDMGYDINVVNEDGKNVLHEAVMNAYCSHGLVKTVLQKEPSLVNRPDKLKKTALHMAMMFDNNEEVVNELLDFGAEIDARDLYLETPLHVAANFKHNLYTILLERGADVNPKNCYLRTPLHCALMRQHPHLNVPLIHALLSHGANVNSIDRGGNSILHYALRNREVKIEIVRLLLEYGAIPDYLDQRKKPPLGYCAKQDIAELLIQYTVLSKFNAFNRQKNEIIVADALLSFDFCKSAEERETWIAFRDSCIVDVVRMTTDKINNKYTFQKFVSERYAQKVTEKKSNELIPDALLLRLYNNSYPSCKEIIYASIKRRDLLKKLFHQPIYTSRSTSESKLEEETIFLNSHCVDHLAKYLSKMDIIHLILAYLDQDLKNFNIQNKAIIPVKRNSEDQSISCLVCKRLKVSVTNNFNYETGLPILPEQTTKA